MEFVKRRFVPLESDKGVHSLSILPYLNKITTNEPVEKMYLFCACLQRSPPGALEAP